MDEQCAGFETRWKQRDLEIPKQRQTFITLAEDDLSRDQDVLAVYYGGSIGNDTADLYSDIDLRIVVNPDRFQAFIDNKYARAKQWGKVTFFEDPGPKASYVVAHYEPFFKADIFYYNPEQIKPSVWLQQIKIVRDPSGFMHNILRQSMDLTYEPTKQEIEHWRAKFFAYLHETYRRVMRKEWYYALRCIDNLRLTIVTGWYMEAGIPPNAFGDWAKYEGERSRLNDEQRSLLGSWDCGRDASEIFRVMKSTASEFKKVHRNLCYKLGIEEQVDWVNHLMDQVIG